MPHGTIDDPDVVNHVCLGHVDPVEWTVRRSDPMASRECPECAARRQRREVARARA